MPLSGRLLAGIGIALVLASAHATGGLPPGYEGKPFADSVYNGGPQAIPGKVQCAYFDLGGEGVAYHNADTRNRGSGMLNPANGSYLNQFRMNEAVGTSYTKFHDSIDNSPYDLVKPAEGQLYVGWTSPGEWFNMTVYVAQAGTYAVDLLYTSNRGGKIALDAGGVPIAPAIDVISTWSAAETIPWRQWHHWNLMKGAAIVSIPKGVAVLTLHIVTEGNMNLAYLDFRRRD
jgi:hypothetical protein